MLTPLLPAVFTLAKTGAIGKIKATPSACLYIVKFFQGFEGKRLYGRPETVPRSHAMRSSSVWESRLPPSLSARSYPGGFAVAARNRLASACAAKGQGDGQQRKAGKAFDYRYASFRFVSNHTQCKARPYACLSFFRNPRAASGRVCRRMPIKPWIS